MPEQTQTIGITAGDPAGIGPEVILKLLANPIPLKGAPRLRIFADHSVIVATAKKLGLGLPDSCDVIGPHELLQCKGPLALVDFKHSALFESGKSTQAAGEASLTYLKAAVEAAQQGILQGLVTAPVTKHAIQQSESSFVGHTEYLAQAFGVKRVVMLFVADSMRVAIVTRHLALKAVSDAIDESLLKDTISMTAQALKEQFGIQQPKLAVCGLNPHAGENGAFGCEEIKVFEPVLAQLRQSGVLCEGPYAADGYFAAKHEHDAVICAYHDQGLIPFKMIARDSGCQMTLGLPIVRTSPDHGSALDIAGRGIADPGAMQYALKTAAELLCVR